MTELPTGTLTLLFSDIEGSTNLLHTLGPRWGEALSAHRAILRQAFADHNGTEMGTEGDSFFVVFRSAHEALDAAVTGQRGLQQHAWPDGATVRVRMGLHTGEPTRHEDGYIGEDVHRAARIGSTANGGQIVISSATHRLVSEETRVHLRDLGHHRLKDLPDGEHLYDVIVDGLLTDFPPLRSLGRAASLPAAPAPLVGRQAEVQALCALLADRGTRFVTLTGPGGVGKTRVATAVAAQLEATYPDGVYFVDLHVADGAEVMWSTISDVVDAGAAAGTDPGEQVCSRLAERSALLVLDNVEQIPDADAVVSALLSAAPRVQVLASSRRPLLLVAEHEFPIGPLGLPSSIDGGDATSSAAVAMFLQRAQMVRPSFALTAENRGSVAQLCQRLDGLPLAIELAAAHLRVLSPKALLSRLDSRLGTGVTTVDRPDRQRSLGATIAWSHDLLTDADRVVFRRLGVLCSPADLDAVLAIAGTEGTDVLDAISRLVEASLVRIDDGIDGEPRVVLLETIRTYALERLTASGDSDATRTRHLIWCRDQVTAATELLRGPLHTIALDRLARIENDIRAALDFALRPGDAGRSSVGQELLITVTTRYWYRFGSVAEARSWQERGLAILADEDSAEKIELLHGLGVSLLQQVQVAAAVQLFDRSLEMSRRLDDRDLEARALNDLALAHRQDGNLAGATDLLQRSLAIARDTGNTMRQAIALGNLVVLHIDQGDYARAAEAAKESMAANAANGDDWGVAIDRLNYTAAVLHSEGPQAAQRHFAQWAGAIQSFRDAELDIDLIEMGAAIASGLGHPELAARLLAAADAQRAAIPLARPPAEETLVQSWLAASRTALSDAEWQQAYISGAELDTARAIEMMQSVYTSGSA
ncbi:MAG: hypothetical protein QOC66_440 [Pseudonocardiales bacterium]|nr:hypothetical protein [Pseudonocardiales bacterium]